MACYGASDGQDNPDVDKKKQTKGSLSLELYHRNTICILDFFW